MTAERPRPQPDASSAPFWDAAARHVLTLAHCSDCGAPTLPPDVVCPNCGSTDPHFEFRPVDGDGRVASWTVVRRSFVSGFEAPFVLVDVELVAAPGVRMIGRLIDGADASLSPGARVSLAFEDLAEGVSVPAFRLVPAA